MGTANAGSIFIALQSFIPNMLNPDAAMSTPPTIDISVTSGVGMMSPASMVSVYIAPCHKNSTGAAHNMPMPYVVASTADVMRSNVALVKR